MSQAFIRVISGSYRNQAIEDVVFPLVKAFQQGAKGGFVTVDGTAMFGKSPIRVKVDGVADYEFMSPDETGALSAVEHVAKPTPAAAPIETDDEVMARIGARFEILHEMTKAACSNQIRAMIVSGPPGVGKSFGVEAELEKAALLDRIAGKPDRFEVVKGAATPIGLYQLLYKHSDKGHVLVFDDCDSILFDELSLNLLKGALDSGKKRRIGWNAESSALRREDIPSSFEFRGSVIFITNLKFEAVKSKKLSDHLEAILSRCHYLDLTLNTMRDKFLRVKQIARTGELFSDYEFSQAQQDDILDFMGEYKTQLREMSLRMAIKLADLYAMSPLKWRDLAKTTCMKSDC